MKEETGKTLEDFKRQLREKDLDTLSNRALRLQKLDSLRIPLVPTARVWDYAHEARLSHVNGCFRSSIICSSNAVEQSMHACNCNVPAYSPLQFQPNDLEGIEMNYEDYEKLMVKEIESVLHPLKKPRILRKINDVGIDFEFDNKGLISIQLSLGRGKSNIIYWDRPKIKPEELLNLTIQFLEEMGAPVYENIFCVGHYTQAEISQLEKWWEKPPRIQQFNGATKWTKKIGGYQLTILDTFGHFPMGLDKIGEKLKFPKFSLEGVGGKTEAYWKKHMRELLKLYPAVFEKYSLTDAEIAIEAWNSLKAEYEPREVACMHATASSITNAER